MPAETCVVEPFGQFAVQSGGLLRRGRSMSLRSSQNRCHVVGLQRAYEDPLRLLLPIGQWYGNSLWGSARTECRRRLTSPESGDHIALETQVLIDLLGSPKVQLQVGVRVLESGKFINNLSGLCGGRGGNDQTVRAEGAPTTCEGLHRCSQVADSEYLMVLALDNGVVAVRLTAGEVDAVLRLPLRAVAAKLHASQTEHAAGQRQDELLETVPADVQIEVPTRWDVACGAGLRRSAEVGVRVPRLPRIFSTDGYGSLRVNVDHPSVLHRGRAQIPSD